MKRLLAAAPLLALIGVLPVHASIIAYIDPAIQGFQAWPGNLALTFDVLSPITVTALGVFNASGTGVTPTKAWISAFETLPSLFPVSTASTEASHWLAMPPLCTEM